MRPPLPAVRVVGAVCDRCGRPYRAGQWPHNCLCTGCNVTAPPAQLIERSRHTELAGLRAENERLANELATANALRTAERTYR